MANTLTLVLKEINNNFYPLENLPCIYKRIIDVKKNEDKIRLNPKISVLMPAYNSEKFIAEAIESILNQTFVDFEFLIINDGSTDNTAEIVRQYSAKDWRIRFIDNKKNQGLIAVLNQGLKLCRGEYIARMDSDDISYLDRFEKQIKYMDSHKDVGILSCWFEYFPEPKKSEIGHHKEVIRFFDVLKGWCINHGMVIIRKDILKKYNLSYNPRFVAAEDYELWSQAIKYTKIRNLQEILYKYRKHGNSICDTQRAIQNENSNKVKKNMLLWLLKTTKNQNFRNYIKNLIKINDYKLKLIPVVVASDDNYSIPLAVCLRSILEKTSAFIDFIILSDNITDKNIRKIKSSIKEFKNFKISFVDMKKFNLNQFPKIDRFETSTFSRYFIPEVCQEYDKVIYTDADVVFNGDISDYYNIDLENKGIAATPEELGNIRRDKFNHEQRKKIFGISQSHLYFAAGNLIISCDYWRKNNITEKLIKKTNELRDKLVCPDLDVMNVIFQNNYKRLHFKYCTTVHRYNAVAGNQEMIEGYKNPFIIHYSGGQKPWNTNIVPFFKEWNDIYEKTAYYLPQKNIKAYLLFPYYLIKVIHWLNKLLHKNLKQFLYHRKVTDKHTKNYNCEVRVCKKLSKLPHIKADCFIPIGTKCRAAHQLQKHGLRKYALPFDYLAGFSLKFIISSLKEGINSWFDEYFEDKTKSSKKERCIYDLKNKFRSKHIFSADKKIEEQMPIFRETFNRRFERLKEVLNKSEHICFVCNNRHEPVPDFAISGKIEKNKKDTISDFVDFLNDLKQMYPHKKWTLLHVEHSDNEHEISEYQAGNDVTIYNIKAYDIHEDNNVKDNNYWKGNTKLWNKICARLSLNSTDKKSTENIKAAFKHFLYHKVKTDSYTKTYICGVRVRKKPANIYSFIDKRLAEFSKTLDAKFAELSKQLAQNSAKTQKDLLAKIADSSKIEQNNFTSLQKDINNKFNNLEKETQLVKSNGLYTIKALNKKLDSLFGMQNTTADFLSAAQKENRDDLLAATEELRENLLNNSAANRQAILGHLEKVLNLAAEQGKTLQTAQQNLQSTAESNRQAILGQLEKVLNVAAEQSKTLQTAQQNLQSTAESAQQAIIKQIETAQSTQQTILGQAEHLKAAVGSQIVGFETLQNSQNETIKSLLAAETAKAEQKFAEQSKNYDILSKKIDNTTSSVITAVERDQILYTNPFEVRTREERGLCDIVNAPDFTNRFRKLIANLPQESVATIVNIIKRLQLIKGTSNKLDLYSAEEKELMKSLKSYFQSILKISDNLYCCQNYFLPINHFEPSVFFYKHGLDKLKNLNYFKNKAILDIGAFIGDSALILSPLTTDKVYSFEATTENYNNMLKTIELNNLTNVVAVKTAVGSENTNIDIRYEGSASSSSELMIKEPKYIEKCPVIRIDDYVKEHNLNVGLIKVDIEGAEQDFLKGAMQTIKEYKPTMLISIYHNIDDFLDIKPMIESWNLGYKFTIFKPVIGSISGETLLICEQ